MQIFLQYNRKTAEMAINWVGRCKYKQKISKFAFSEDDTVRHSHKLEYPFLPNVRLEGTAQLDDFEA